MLSTASLFRVLFRWLGFNFCKALLCSVKTLGFTTARQRHGFTLQIGEGVVLEIQGKTIPVVHLVLEIRENRWFSYSTVSLSSTANLFRALFGVLGFTFCKHCFVPENARAFTKPR